MLNAKIPSREKGGRQPDHGTLAFRLSGHHMLGLVGAAFSNIQGLMHACMRQNYPSPKQLYSVFANSIVGLIDVPGFPRSLDHYIDGCAV